MRAVALLSLVLIAMPGALAGPLTDRCIGGACIAESYAGDPSCEGEWHHGWTYVGVDGVAEAWGFRECGTAANGNDVRAEGVIVSAGPANVLWLDLQVEEERTCVFIAVPAVAPCVLPPPPLSWGRLLP